MLVTFGREATQELRERVRERLVSAERGLRDPAAARAGTDRCAALLADVPDAEAARAPAPARRRARASSTPPPSPPPTSSASRCWPALGVAGDAADAVFVESVDDLVAEVVDDFYVRKYAAAGAGTPAFDRAEALRLARRAVDDPQARLEPRRAPSGTAAVRHCFATAVRAEVERRKRARGCTPTTTCSPGCTTRWPTPSAEAAQRLRARYRVVLVDEFQDTDPVQWAILRALPRARHAGADRRPQAGDLRLPRRRRRQLPGRRRAAPTAHATLARNWRSDAALLRALDTVFGGAALGDPRIVVRPVESAHPVPRLRGAPGRHPAAAAGAAPRRAAACSGRGLVAHSDRPATWSPATWPRTSPRCSPAGRDGGGRPAAARRRRGAGPHERPGHAGARRARRRRGARGAVRAPRASSAPRPRAEWLTLLEALEQPRPIRIRAAALTCFVGRTVAELCELDGATSCSTSWARPCARWAAVLHGTRRRRAAGGGHHRHRPARAAAGVGGRRAAAHRPAARRAGAARRRRRRAPRPGRAGRVAAPPHRRGRGGHRGSSAAGGWSPTPRRCRSSPCTAARAWSSRSSTCRSAWDRYVPREPDVPLLHDDAGTRVLDVGGEPGGPAGRSAAPATRPRRPGRTCGCSTSRSPGRAARSWPGGRRRRPRRPRRCTGCCSGDAVRGRRRRRPVRSRTTPRR